MLQTLNYLASCGHIVDHCCKGVCDPVSSRARLSKQKLDIAGTSNKQGKQKMIDL